MSKKRRPPRQSWTRRTRDTRKPRRRRRPRIPFPSQQSRLDDNALNDVESLKFTYAMWVQNHPSGSRQMARLENALRAGRLAFLPKNEVEHWGMEEYLWHGMPGHDWDPIEAFLEGPGHTFSESGRKQFRRWKEMRIGFYEIGQVGDRTVDWKFLKSV